MVNDLLTKDLCKGMSDHDMFAFLEEYKDSIIKCVKCKNNFVTVSSKKN